MRTTTTLLCFGATSGAGNPALVVEDGPAGAAARQAFAQARASTAVFLDRGAGAHAPWMLDYYYPHTRSPLCLHATLAAAHVLFASPSFPRRREPHFAEPPPALAVTTAMRGQPLLLSREGDDYYVRLAVQPAPTLEALPDLAALLGRPGLAGPAQVASVGSPKLLVEVADAATLHGLRPDLAAIVAWGKQAGVNGIYAWCRHPDGRYEGRNFNHLDPALEDRATGVAAGALTVALGHGLALLQGGDCLIRTRRDGDAILVGGRATPALLQ